MTRRKNLTDEEKATAFDLRERLGWSHERIARKLQCTAASISWHCLQAGADAPNAKPLDPTIKGPTVSIRNGKPVRRYLPEDDALLLKLAGQKKNPSQIGRIMKRRPNSILGRLMTLARHEERRSNGGTP